MTDFMRAARIRRFGGPEVLKVEHAPVPVAARGQVVVHVRAASVNRVDCSVRAGSSTLAVTFPHTPGRDFSGVVAAVGEDADIEVGEEVVGVCANGVEGAYAERIAIESNLLARKPFALEHTTAAAVGVAGLAAVAALLDTLTLRPSERLLINGGSGGVGSLAALAAKRVGTWVGVTAGQDKHQYVKDLGADAVFTYGGFPAGQFDAALDTIGGIQAGGVFDALKPGGRAAFLASGANAPRAPRSDLLSLRPRVDRGRAALERAFASLPASCLAALRVTQVPLAEAAYAHELLEGRGVCGKVVLLC